MIEVQPYKDRFAVYEDGVLLAVCSFRKGAVAVKDRLEALQHRIQELQAACSPVSSSSGGSPCANR